MLSNLVNKKSYKEIILALCAWDNMNVLPLPIYCFLIIFRFAKSDYSALVLQDFEICAQLQENYAEQNAKDFIYVYTVCTVCIQYFVSGAT